MPKFSLTSHKRLETCHFDLQMLMHDAITYVDFAVVCGHRGKKEQNKAFDEGKSKLKFPHGKHNALPSLAIDIAPWVDGAISWNPKHCIYLAGWIMALSVKLRARGLMTYPIRWGGNWDMDGEVVTDQRFNDLVHFELMI